MLRIGVMLDSLSVSRWGAEMLQQIHGSPCAKIELLIINCRKTPSRQPLMSSMATHWRSIPAVGWRYALELFHRCVLEGKSRLDDPFQKVPLPDGIGDIAKLEVVPIAKRFSDYLSPDDTERVRSYELDVIVRLGFRILRGEILNVPRFGLWSLHHGDNRVCRGGPAGFWESMLGWPTTGSTLQILTEDLDNGQVLARTSVATNRWSVQENRANLFWKTAELIPRKLAELHRLGSDVFFQRAAAKNLRPMTYCRPMYKAPNNRQLFQLVTKRLMDKTRNLVREKTTNDRWLLLYSIGEETSSSFWRFRPIAPPAERYWADPHALYRDGTYYVFFEDYCLRTGLGQISVIAIDEKGRVSRARTALKRDYHLSYPFVFEWDGQTYMIPETGARRSVELYRCAQLPDQWEHVMNLMDGVHLVDVTLHYDQRRWWLFAGRASHRRGSRSDETVLFFADDFRTTDWQPHPCNPIADEVTASRPAGALFSRHGRLYRPVQNCAWHYGYGFQLCEVTELSPDNFEEHIVDSITPDWNPKIVGTHTFTHVGKLTVIDALQRNYRWSRWG